jgi:hypothetical protein
MTISPNQTVVYGASDDLIEIEGSIREEFYATEKVHDDGDLLAFSNGVVLRVRYDTDGVWRLSLVAGTGVKIEQAPANDEDGNYSDTATLEPVGWVVHGHEWARA